MTAAEGTCTTTQLAVSQDAVCVPAFCIPHREAEVTFGWQNLGSGIVREAWHAVVSLTGVAKDRH